MKHFNIGEIVSQAWDMACKHWPIFILLALISAVLSSLLGGSIDPNAIASNSTPEELTNMLLAAYGTPWALINILVSVYFSFITYRCLMNAVYRGKTYETMGDVFKVDLAKLAFFIVVNVVLGFAIAAGLALCIIPGIILSVRWLFTPLIAATEDVSFSEAFGKSWRMTQGHVWHLIGLCLVMMGVAILGFCACCVGIIFAEVIINFMLALVYVELKPEDDNYVPYEEVEETTNDSSNDSENDEGGYTKNY